MNSQKQMVLLYLQQTGSITQLDAYKEFGCLNLRNRIGELEKDGIPIRHVSEVRKNRFGRKIRITRYVLDGSR